MRCNVCNNANNCKIGLSSEGKMDFSISCKVYSGRIEGKMTDEEFKSDSFCPIVDLINIQDKQIQALIKKSEWYDHLNLERLEQDNKCYSCHMNHIGVEGIINFAKDKVNWFESYKVDDNLTLGKYYAFKELLEYINAEPEVRKVE